jgi:hypothetical protein
MKWQSLAQVEWHRREFADTVGLPTGTAPSTTTRGPMRIAIAKATLPLCALLAPQRCEHEQQRLSRHSYASYVN